MSLLAESRAHIEGQWLATAKFRPGWLDLYRASATAEYRAPVAAAFASVAPFETVLDLGCNCGALMPLLLAASPSCQVLGVDLAPNAIAAAKVDWPAHTWACASIVDWLPMMAVCRRVDLVVSGSVLGAVVPTDLDAVLTAIATLATRAIVLQEPTTTPRFGEGISPAGVPEWRYDYVTRFAARGWRLASRVWQEIETDRPGAVMVFRHDKEQTT